MMDEFTQKYAQISALWVTYLRKFVFCISIGICGLDVDRVATIANLAFPALHIVLL